MGTGLPPALKKFIQKKKQKKKAANPNLREGTKQTKKNRLKKLMEMRKDPAKRKKLPSRFQPAKKPAAMLKRGGKVKKK